jgi:hypothetical protein
MIPVSAGKTIFKVLRWLGLNVGKDGIIFFNFAKKLGKILYSWK